MTSHSHPPSSLEDNKALVRRYVEAFNRGAVDLVCLCFGPEALVHGVLGWGEVAKVRLIWEELVNAFRLNLAIEAIVAEGDTVAVRFTERGTFTTPFRGTPPTGKSYEVTALEWFVIRDGLIHRRWGARDSASIVRQMGIPLS